MAHWLIGELNPQSPVFWLLLGTVITVGLAVAHWRTQSPWVLWLWIGQWVLIPYFGLLFGGLSPRLMGLGYLDWPATFGLGSGLVFITVVLLVAVRATLAFSDRTPSDPSPASQTDPSPADADERDNAPMWHGIVWTIFLSGAEEFHWVFLRGAIWEILLTAPDSLQPPVYWAIWIAAGFVIFETALRRVPFEQWLVQITVLIATSILFLYTRNFWLCWILHSTAVFILTTDSRHLRSYPAT